MEEEEFSQENNLDYIQQCLEGDCVWDNLELSSHWLLNFIYWIPEETFAMHLEEKSFHWKFRQKKKKKGGWWWWGNTYFRKKFYFFPCLLWWMTTTKAGGGGPCGRWRPGRRNETADPSPWPWWRKLAPAAAKIPTLMLCSQHHHSPGPERGQLLPAEPTCNGEAAQAMTPKFGHFSSKASNPTSSSTISKFSPCSQLGENLPSSKVSCPFPCFPLLSPNFWGTPNQQNASFHWRFRIFLIFFILPFSFLPRMDTAIRALSPAALPGLRAAPRVRSGADPPGGSSDPRTRASARPRRTGTGMGQGGSWGRVVGFVSSSSLLLLFCCCCCY